MSRAFFVSAILAILAGCHLPDEQTALKPLPQDVTPQPYAELVARARVLVESANKAFYDNKWLDLEDAAKGMETTAKFLVKASDVPARHQVKLAVEAGDLGREAGKLASAAKAHEVQPIIDSLQKINLKVRELRPED